MLEDFPFIAASNATAAQFICDIPAFDGRLATLLPPYAAYARIFHPIPIRSHCKTSKPRYLRWFEVAQIQETLCHRNMQVHAILRRHPHSIREESILANALAVGLPLEGSLPADLARLLINILQRHTDNPQHCYFAIWEGFGGMEKQLLDAASFSIPGRAYHLFHAPLETASANFDRHDREDCLQAEAIVFAADYQKQSQKSGKHLREEIAKEWRACVEAGLIPLAPLEHRSANLYWSQQENWCVASEIDFNSSYVGGSKALIADILAEPKLEAFQVYPNDDITIASDRLNPNPYQAKF